MATKRRRGRNGSAGTCPVSYIYDPNRSLDDSSDLYPVA